MSQATRNLVRQLKTPRSVKDVRSPLRLLRTLFSYWIVDQSIVTILPMLKMPNEDIRRRWERHPSEWNMLLDCFKHWWYIASQVGRRSIGTLCRHVEKRVRILVTRFQVTKASTHGRRCFRCKKVYLMMQRKPRVFTKHSRRTDPCCAECPSRS